MFSEKVKNIFKSREGKIAVCIGVVTVICFFLVRTESLVSEDGYILRKSYGEGTEYVNMVVSIEGAGEERLEVEIEDLRYTEAECEEMYFEALEQLEEIMLGDNDSTDCVYSNLNFPSGLEDFPFEVEWRSSDREVVNDNGEITAGEIRDTFVTATFTYGEWEREKTYHVFCFPNTLVTPQGLMDALGKTIKEREEETREESALYLPQEISGYKVTYKDSNAGKNYAILLFGITAIVMIFIAGRKDSEKKEKERKNRIEREYSILVQKTVMYLSSGMSIRNVMSRIYSDAVSSGRENPLYDEMYILINELKTGVSESVAYDNFSKRTGSPEIKRFTTLLSQNLKTGSTNLSKLLGEEAAKAFKSRQQRARVKGEEAGTGLIIPMVILMTMVMAIIMVPAFMSM